MIQEELNEFDDDDNDDLTDEEENETDVEDATPNKTSVREDKIFNNRYNTGDGLTDNEFLWHGSKISVSSDYSDAYLKDVYEYEDSIETRVILDAIFNFFQVDPQVSEIIRKASVDPYLTRAKLSKDDINSIFNRVNQRLELKPEVAMFYSPIYIVEAISSVSSIEYKKLFDMFETDIQEILLTELNKKYKFLDGKNNKKRIH